MGVQTLLHKVFRKFFFFTRLCKAFFADHFDIRKLRTELRNDGAIAKIKNHSKVV